MEVSRTAPAPLMVRALHRQEPSTETPKQWQHCLLQELPRQEKPLLSKAVLAT